MNTEELKRSFCLFLCMALLAGCGSGMSAAKEPEGEEKETAVSQEETAEEESSEPAEAENADEIENSLPKENISTGEEELQEESVGTVSFTVFSPDDSKVFSGKELKADPVYLQTAVSSEVYCCEKPLSKIEIHPIQEWAEDFSSFILSDEVLGSVGPVDAEEPFRIYDLYPEGIPVNCLVFWLEDGSCGVFSLGYNGSGEEQSWKCSVYRSYASMDASREKEVNKDRSQ